MIKIAILSIVILFILIVRRIKMEAFETQQTSIKYIDKPKNWNSLPFVKKLQIYGVNLTPQHAIYADKYRVKDLIKNIDELYVPQTLKVFDIKDDTLDLKNLPLKCIIKTNNGWNDLIFIENSQITKMISRGRKFNIYKDWKNKSITPHIKKYQKHYKYISPVIFAEEWLGDDLTDYKFYCFWGKIKFIHVDSSRFTNHSQRFYDNNFNIINNLSKNNKSSNGNQKKPKNFNTMKKIVEEIAKKFEFARIDVYNINGKIYFGEITLTPDACENPFSPPEYDMKIGKYWNINI